MWRDGEVETKARLFLFLTGLLTCCGISLAQRQYVPHVYIKHMSPLSYSNIARVARIQGTIVVRLMVRGDGKVVGATASSPSHSPEQPANAVDIVLVPWTTRMINQWVFGCSGCKSDDVYEYSITFVYRVEGKSQEKPGLKVKKDLPDEITLIVHPTIAEY